MVSRATKRKMMCQEKEEGAKRKKVLLREPRLVETRNAFSALEEVSVIATGLDKERKEGADTGSLPQGRVLVLGDS